MKGEEAGVLVVDDYAHHPEELRVTLRAAREGMEQTKDRAKAQSELRLAELDTRLARETVALATCSDNRGSGRCCHGTADPNRGCHLARRWNRR